MSDQSSIDSRDDAKAAIRAVPELAAIADQLEALLMPTIRVDMEPGPQGPIDSRFGGLPVMLPDDGWPTRIHEPYLGRDPSAETFTLAYGEPEEMPLTFLAHVNLAQIPRVGDPPLPPDGLLSFFVDPHAYGADAEEQEAFRLFYIPAERFAELEEREMPNMQTAGVFPTKPLNAFRMTFATRYQLPVFTLLDAMMPGRVKHEALGELQVKLRGGHGVNGMFVNPVSSTEDPREITAEKAGVSYRGLWDKPTERLRVLEQIYREWVVLFSVGGNDQLPLPGSIWHLAFVMRREDLLAKRFDKFWGSASN